MARLYEEFSAVAVWEGDILHQIVVNLAETMTLGLGKVAQPLRVAVCGSSISPSIDVTLSLLGKDKTLARIDRAIKFIRSLN